MAGGRAKLEQLLINMSALSFFLNIYIYIYLSRGRRGRWGDAGGQARSGIRTARRWWKQGNERRYGGRMDKWKNEWMVICLTLLSQYISPSNKYPFCLFFHLPSFSHPVKTTWPPLCNTHFQTVAISDGRVEGVMAGPTSQIYGMLGSALIKNLSLDPSDHTSKRWWMDRRVCMRVCICWHSMCWNMERKPHITLLIHIFLSIHCPDSLIHIQTCAHTTHTYTLLSAQSSVSSPSWPIRRSGLWSLPLDLLGLFW